MKTSVFMVLVVLLNACSDHRNAEPDSAVEEHVWSDQVNTIDKARNVEDVLGEASNRQLEDIEQQSR